MNLDALDGKNKNEGLTPQDKEWQEMVKNLENNNDGLIRESLGKKVQGVMNESGLPNEDYRSTVGVYGGRMLMEEGKMVWDRNGIVSKIDKKGDEVLRSYDEHTVKEPGKLLKRHPKIAAEKFFHPGTKRFRGSNEEICENIDRLGLSEFYGPHENGIEIKNQEVYTKGAVLQDIYRADLIKSEKLDKIDRFQALAEAGKYIKNIHDKHGGVGEILVSDIIFQKVEDGKLSDPVLKLPDIVCNKEKKTGEKDKKTTDMLDFLCSVYGEEKRKSQDPDNLDKALDTIISNYGDKDIISMAESFIKRGRLTLQGDKEILNFPNTITKKARGFFSQHNKARLGSKTGFEGEMKEKIKDACERFLSKEQ